MLHGLVAKALLGGVLAIAVVALGLYARAQAKEIATLEGSLATVQAANARWQAAYAEQLAYAGFVEELLAEADRQDAELRQRHRALRSAMRELEEDADAREWLAAPVPGAVRAYLDRLLHPAGGDNAHRLRAGAGARAAAARPSHAGAQQRHEPGAAAPGRGPGQRGATLQRGQGGDPALERS